MSNLSIGVTFGVYDLFHIGHLNIIRNAKKMCNKLIVAVATDELTFKLKNRQSIINFEDRFNIISAIKYVDLVIPLHDTDILTEKDKLKFNVIFKGDDWYNTPKWIKLEKEAKEHNISVIYLPRTEGISSTIIKKKLSKWRKDECR
jgi:glycerol-3-phosphate cytidylyltransferase